MRYIMALVKVDLFAADKKMSSRVEEYVKVRVLKKAINKSYAEKIDSINNSIKSANNLIGTIAEDTVPAILASLNASLDATIKERDEQIKKECTFELTENDKTFKRALKGLNVGENDRISRAIIVWFKHYNLDVTNSTLLADIISAIGGKEDYNKFVDTEGQNGLSVNESNALNMLYWVAFNHMATMGTIKPAQIPDIIKNNFGKAAKEAKKNNK